MRTTLTIDDDVLAAVRALARADGRSLGEVLTELARRGLAPSDPRLDEERGLPVFRVTPGARPLTDEMVAAALDEM